MTYPIYMLLIKNTIFEIRPYMASNRAEKARSSIKTHEKYESFKKIFFPRSHCPACPRLGLTGVFFAETVTATPKMGLRAPNHVC